MFGFLITYVLLLSNLSKVWNNSVKAPFMWILLTKKKFRKLMSSSNADELVQWIEDDKCYNGCSLKEFNSPNQ